MFDYGEIKFRALEIADLEFLYHIRSDEEVSEYLFSAFPLCMSNQQEWFKKFLAKENNTIFIVLNKNKECIGYLRLSNIDFLNRRLEIGLDIHKLFRGKGYGTLIYKAAIQYCFNILNMHKIYLYTFEENKRAVHLYKKLGFILEGSLKDYIFRNGWKTVLLMSKFKSGESLD